jgi:ABC-2 type transport system ATP-binding protein
MLRIRNLSKSFGAHSILRDLSLDLEPGRVTALLARNGAGKSTLVSLIAGRLQADSGSILFEGTSLASKAQKKAAPGVPDRYHAPGMAVVAREIARRIGVAPQDTGIYPDLRISENVRFAGGCYGLRGRQLARAADQALAMLGLMDIATSRARTLSGGQKRRLHTAMAIVHKPALLLLDEPTVGSDPEARQFILSAVRTLAAQGATVLYTSHYFPEIEALGADVAVLDEGRIVEHASLPALRQKFERRAAVDLESIFLSLVGGRAAS